MIVDDLGQDVLRIMRNDHWIHVASAVHTILSIRRRKISVVERTNY